MQAEELYSIDIPHRVLAMLALEEQCNHSLDNLKHTMQIVKKYFDKKYKSVNFIVKQKVLLWDSAHTNKGKHHKFQKLWIGPFKIATFVGPNSYLLKDYNDHIIPYTMNGSHLKPCIDVAQ